MRTPRRDYIDGPEINSIIKFGKRQTRHIEGVVVFVRV